MHILQPIVAVAQKISRIKLYYLQTVNKADLQFYSHVFHNQSTIQQTEIKVKLNCAVFCGHV